MRFHTLEIEGFGSFYHRTRIDFDTLSRQGLFLIFGETGAGKSTILDALVYALYGRVANANDESSDDRALSNYWDLSYPPRVELVFSTQDCDQVRYYRVTRTVKYLKPGRKNPTPAQVSLESSPSLDFQNCTLTEGPSEVNPKLIEIIGLDRAQFEQIVLLPQGKVQKFLTSDSKDRSVILEQLFHAQVFNRITDLAKSRLRQVSATRANHFHAQAQGMQNIFTLLQQIEWQPSPPPQWSQIWQNLQDLAANDPDKQVPWEQILPLLQAALLLLEERREQASAQLKTSQDNQTRAELALQAARESAEVISQARAWTQELQSLVSHQAQMDALEASNRDALRAQAVLAAAAKTKEPYRDALESWRKFLLTVDRIILEHPGLSHLQAEVDLLQLEPQAGLDNAKHISATVSSLLGNLEDFAQKRSLELQQTVNLLAKRDQVYQTLQSAQLEVTRLEKLHEANQLRVRQLSERHETDLAKLENARKLADSLPGARTIMQDLEQKLQSFNEYKAFEKQFELASQQLEAARKNYAMHTHAEFQLRAQWIASTAPRLAATLEEEQPCPVCGSTQHPAPAQSTTQPIGEEELQQASQLSQLAQTQLGEASDAVSELRGSLDSLTKVLRGIDTTALAQEHLRATENLRRCETAAEDLDTLEQHLSDTAQALDATRALTENTQTELTTQRTLRESFAAELEKLAGQIEKSLPEGISAEQAPEMIQNLEQVKTLGATAREQADTWRGDQARYAALLHALDSTLHEQGFDTLEAAQAVAKAEADLQRDQAKVSRYHDEVRQLRAQLDTPKYRGCAHLSLPQLDELEAAAQQSKTALDQAQDTHTKLHTWAQSLCTQRDQLQSQDEQWQKTAASTRVVASLFAKLNGETADGITLTRYFLSTRLTTVVKAANAFLQQQSLGHYRIEQTNSDSDSRARNTKGLGLALYDDFTGKSTSPKSLSGGEKFYISLALTMGLSDTVQNENGGITLENIFIDEGFGRLDPNTRNSVMEALNRLHDTSGSRCVGLISHVEDLKEQIPLQLEVINRRGNPGGDAKLRGSYLKLHGVE